MQKSAIGIIYAFVTANLIFNFRSNITIIIFNESFGIKDMMKRPGKGKIFAIQVTKQHSQETGYPDVIESTRMRSTGMDVQELKCTTMTNIK